MPGAQVFPLVEHIPPIPAVEPVRSAGRRVGLRRNDEPSRELSSVETSQGVKLSSCGFGRLVFPCDFGVVGDSADQAAVQDADESVGDLP